MVKLRDVYSNVENPLDNQEMLQQIVSAYAKSDRTDLSGSSNLYSSLVKMNQSKDNTSINLSDKEAFLVDAYNQWIENMINLDDAHINYLETKKGMNAKAMQQYLRSFGKVASMEDIKRLKSNPLFEEETNGWELNDGWDHIKSQYISARRESRISVKHRLYVGCQNQDMWRLAQLFKSKCETLQIPFYFKLDSSSSGRDDKMVIYADTDNLGNYISALQEIAKENPEIIQRCGEPPAMTGKIDGWIGIGDEPPLKENGENQSYNSLRADIFENAIEESLISDITEFKGKDVTYKGRQTRFNEIFMEIAAKTIIDKLDEGKGHSSTKLSNYGLREEDLSNVKFKEHIKFHLKKNIQKGLNKLIEVKDIKAQLAISNGQAIFSIPTREGKSVAVNTYDMDTIIKSMVPIMQEVDPHFMEKVKSQIQEKCRQNGIDDTFCFQQGSKEKFEKMDSAQTVKTDIEKTTKNPQSREMMSAIHKTKPQKQEPSTSISSIEIVDLLNPKVLKQRIELPNGAQISARQYIQEFVAPHIPSNGTYILNNGSQIQAKQYIEEYILGEGQQKYKGNISKLLSENTRSNNGTININGEQINSIDIVDSLNPELMKKRLKLPNGVEIPAKQYVQEYVAPHIPSNGKFILKSNGMGLSAKQFIEEAVMFEGQQKYNGDINALLDAMTVANNGTISVGTRTKAPRGQGLKQEMGISQAQAEKIKREKEEKLRGEQEEKARQEKEEQINVENANSSQCKKLGLTELRTAVKQGKVTTSETQRATKEMGDIYAVKRLQIKRQMGVQLTEEQQRQVEEYEKQKAQIREQHKKQQNNKGMSLGL